MRQDQGRGAVRPASLGHGIGLRAPHFDEWLLTTPDVGWVECITENFLDVGGRPRHVLEHVRGRMPIAFHGVSLSIGSTDPLDKTYLASVRRLAAEIEPVWLTDHLCWTSVDGVHVHDLLPLPYTEEVLTHVTSRVHAVQEALGRPIGLENPSTYLEFAESQLTEPEFFSELTKRTGCGIVLDVNNAYVNARNHGFSALDYVHQIPPDAVWQLHLAGHTDLGTHLVDTHDAPVCDAVWSLYGEVLRRFGRLPTLIEWDGKIPSLGVVVDESHKALELERRALCAAGAA